MVSALDELKVSALGELAIAQSAAATPAASAGPSASDLPLPVKISINEGWYQAGSGMVQIPPPPGLEPGSTGDAAQDPRAGGDGLLIAVECALLAFLKKKIECFTNFQEVPPATENFTLACAEDETGSKRVAAPRGQEVPPATENFTLACVEDKTGSKKAKPRRGPGRGTAARPAKTPALPPGLVSASDATQWASESAARRGGRRPVAPPLQADNAVLDALASTVATAISENEPGSPTSTQASKADNAALDALASTVATAISENEPKSPTSTQASRQAGKRLICNFVFTVSPKRLEEFGIVPRLIGYNGANMKKISQACDAKVRIRGKGSRHLEGRQRKEANLPLQVALSCPTQEGFSKAKEMVKALLAVVAAAFAAECQKTNVKPPHKFYTVVEPLHA